MFVVIFIAAMTFAIMLHEFGHYWTARRFGMKAEKFFVGFGPTLWSTHRGETEYGVKAIPAGGFVKIVGMTPDEEFDPADEPRAFYRQPAWQRAIVLVSGSVTHFVLAAVLLFSAMAFFALPEVRDGEPVISNTVGATVEDSPAAGAGLQPGDVIAAVDGTPTPDFETVRATVGDRPGETAVLTVERDGGTREVPVTLAEREGAGFLGVAPTGFLTTERGVGEALLGVVSGPYSLAETTGATLAGIRDVFTPAQLEAWLSQADGSTERTADGPISLVGAGQVVNRLGALGAISVIILLLAQLNIVLGALNMLPLPPLDGGHLAVLTIEKVVNVVRGARGATDEWRLDPGVVTPVALAVILVLGLFSLTAIYIDIVNPASSLLN